VYGLWVFYRQYTHSAIHAASAAALTIFGLLVFIHPFFAAMAIAAYVCPPVVLYVLGYDVGMASEHPPSTDKYDESKTALSTDSTTDPEGDKRDSKASSVGVGADSSSDDGDTDSDSDNGDSDSDGDDGDTDSDSDNGDSDSDGDDGDTDSD